MRVHLNILIILICGVQTTWSTGRADDQALFRPLPSLPDVDPAKVALGRRLFNEPALSRDGSISCASCHDLAHGGADGRRSAKGIDGQISPVNTPTVFNASLNFRQFWDGRALSLEDQIDGPILNPLEMGSSWDAVLAQLNARPTYVQAFVAVYGGGASAATVRDAIATFERTLLTPGAPFDRFLQGDHDALDAEQQRGFALFKDLGCASCHQGVGLGGNMFQEFGVVRSYFQDHAPTSPADLGHFNVTHDPIDQHVFKVPSLRNVALTAPYFHDGSAATLTEAVRIMAAYQLGRTLPAKDVAAIVAFLGALTGHYAEGGK